MSARLPEEIIEELKRMLRNCEARHFELAVENKLLREALDPDCNRARRAEIMRKIHGSPE